MTSGSELSLSSGSCSACSWVRDFHQKTNFIPDLSPLPFGCQTCQVADARQELLPLASAGCGRFPRPVPSAAGGPGSPPTPRALEDCSFFPRTQQPPDTTSTSGFSLSSSLALVPHFPKSQMLPQLQGGGEDAGLMRAAEQSPSASRPGGSWGGVRVEAGISTHCGRPRTEGAVALCGCPPIITLRGARQVVWLQLRGAVTHTPSKSPALCVQLCGFRVFTVLYSHHNFRMFPSPPQKKL